MASRTDDDGPAEPETPAPSLLEQMGGVSGLIYSTIPVLVFVPANTAFGLRAAIVAALAAAAVIFAIRLARRERLAPAISGLLGVAICVFIANRVGDAKGYFLFGIWTTLVYAVVFVISIVVRWPLVGVAWNLVNGDGMGWRRHRRTLLAYDLATALWAAVFGARYLAQSRLYDEGETGWLAVTRIAMGWPLTALAILGTILLVRRATREEHDVEQVADGADEAEDRGQ
ncbi:DUF3159 domain-containing protein [Gordonia sp. ABSL1-1]|uniref:DUF3159 domain-containing protein n=1 Tax=Gordonia sp. ABSL1-1 TaxID=3053923 RepID=UPI0025731301|nr:DUF3159 domain-containing protein [Gordonia sp. ABSL1-1]MDL9936396.1 DUF3159 domain-containing protein [Gordonia sp. ABSL1-1]